MKWFFISLFLLPLGAFSQKVILQINERQELVSYRKTSLDSVLANPDATFPPDTVNTCFVFNLNDKTSNYYVEGKFLSVLPIETFFNETGELVVKILQEGLDYGLLLNTDDQHPTAYWFWFEEDKTTVKKMTRFQFIKPG